jgi:hypothetical protein
LDGPPKRISRRTVCRGGAGGGGGDGDGERALAALDFGFADDTGFVEAADEGGGGRPEFVAVVSGAEPGGMWGAEPVSRLVSLAEDGVGEGEWTRRGMDMAAPEVEGLLL